MKHHFTVSERLAILVYQILREGGFVGYEYTDMVSSEIKLIQTPVLGQREGEKRIERTIIFTCDNPFSEGEKLVEVRLLGWENECRIRSWKLLDVCKVFGGVPPVSGFRQRVYLPTSSDQSYEEIARAEIELKRCKARGKLYTFMVDCPFTAEREEN